MPKKKFIIGPVATYSIIPRQDVHGKTSNHAWLRTDTNVGFKPFPDDRYLDISSADDKIDACESCGEADLDSFDQVKKGSEYDYEKHLRVIGLDPAAVFLQAERTRSPSIFVPNPDDEAKPQGTGGNPVSSSPSELDSEVDAVVLSLKDLELAPLEGRYGAGYDEFFDHILGTISCKTAIEQPNCDILSRPIMMLDADSNLTWEDEIFQTLVQSYEDISIDQVADTHIDHEQNSEFLHELLYEKSLQREVAQEFTASRRTTIDKPKISLCGAFDKVNGLDAYPKSNIRSKWDCGTVVSTYSVSDHHPRILTTNVSRQIAEVKVSMPANNKVNLTPMHSLPRSEQGIPAPLNDRYFTDTSDQTLPRSSDRSFMWREEISRRGESKEEKKIRKAAVKVGRKEARFSKKQIKSSFRREEKELRRSSACSNDVPPSVSIKNFS